MNSGKSIDESIQSCGALGQFLHALCPGGKTLVWTQEELNEELDCGSLSVVFDETYIYVKVCMYIYIYTLIYKCLPVIVIM